MFKTFMKEFISRYAIGSNEMIKLWNPSNYYGIFEIHLVLMLIALFIDRISPFLRVNRKNMLRMRIFGGRLREYPELIGSKIAETYI